EEALDDVVDGVVQATVVDAVALECYKGRKPARFAKLRVILESEPFPAGVVAYSPGALDEATLRRFRVGMINASQSPRGQQLLNLPGIKCFEERPAAYDQMLADIIKASPPPPAASPTPTEVAPKAKAGNR